MDHEEALRILGLDKEADSEQIKSRFKVLANAAHSDKGGSDEKMSQLLEARDAALNASDSKFNLKYRILINAILSLVTPSFLY